MGTITTTSTRLSSTAFKLDFVVTPMGGFGFDLKLGTLLITTIYDDISPTITVEERDASYLIYPFFWDGVTRTDAAAVGYKHYRYEIALRSSAIIIDLDTKIILNNTLDSKSVHGSILYNGYVYGTTRGVDASGYSHLVKAPIDDIANYTATQIKINDVTAERATIGEQIVECGGYLYFRLKTDYLVQYNPALNDYKIFKNTTYFTGDYSPIHTDGQYLFFNHKAADKIYKIDSSNFIGEFPKYNTDVNFAVIVAATYNAATQGGYILGAYPSLTKGDVHSFISDTEYLYAAYTTDTSGVVSGYSATLGLSVNEVHKIRISDMTAAGFVKIPKATDDCSQNATHIFYGTELLNNASVNAYGYGWSIHAVRKSDLRVTGIPKQSDYDSPPYSQSYGTYVYGKYLFDIRTSRVINIIDTSDVDNWLPTEDAGKRLIASYYTQYLGAYLPNPINELLLAPDKSFRVFLFANPSELGKMQLPLDWTPAVSSPFPALSLTQTHRVVANIVSNNGDAIISRGFKYGLAPATLINTIESTDITDEFGVDIPNELLGVYYFQAYAITIEGESQAGIKGFSRLNYHWRMKVAIGGSATYSNDNQVVSFKPI